MGASVLTAAAMPMCMHAGTGVPMSRDARVVVSGAPVLCVGDPVLVSHCRLDASQGEPPCTSIHTHGSARITASGRAVAIAAGAISEPGGWPATVTALQTRVLAG